ncbi:MAG: homoserine dehydrogenase [Lachnospiraceae bacterium]|nr:homoserine dehydrogenase [Lachnospiraceae bacterium]
MVNIAILGYGTVGSGVFEIINTNQEIVNFKAGKELKIKYVLDLRDFPGTPVENLLVRDMDTIVNDPEVEVVVEAMGGVEPAYTYVKSALLAGKSVCTSNKELVAKHGAELIKIAKDHNRNFLFEASVGGGIPIIRPLNQHITADRICEITGILNGTTNYILTKMDKEGLDFDTVLKEAQALGYAEKDPTADVEGFDACRKIAILASLANGKSVDFEDIYTEGISKISDTDFKYAEKMGRSIKLLGKCKLEDDGIVVSVSPRLLAPSHPLFHVSDVVNGVLIRGNVVGDLVFIGSGAGKLPTASAVVSDVVDAVRHLNVPTTIQWEAEKLEVLDFSKSKKQFFVRVAGQNKEQIENAFGEVTYVDAGIQDELGFITRSMSENSYEDAASKVEGVITRIRIEA